MGNYENCVEQLIEERVRSILKRLPDLNPEERYACIMENIEEICSPIDMKDVLMVPQFQDKELKG